MKLPESYNLHIIARGRVLSSSTHLPTMESVYEELDRLRASVDIRIESAYAEQYICDQYVDRIDLLDPQSVRDIEEIAHLPFDSFTSVFDL